MVVGSVLITLNLDAAIVVKPEVALLNVDHTADFLVDGVREPSYVDT